MFIKSCLSFTSLEQATLVLVIVTCLYFMKDIMKMLEVLPNTRYSLSASFFWENLEKTRDIRSDSSLLLYVISKFIDFLNCGVATDSA